MLLGEPDNPAWLGAEAEKVLATKSTTYDAIGRTTADLFPANVVRAPATVATPDAGSGQSGAGLPHLGDITAPEGSPIDDTDGHTRGYRT